MELWFLTVKLRFLAVKLSVSYRETKCFLSVKLTVSCRETKCFLSVKLTETSGIALSTASFSMIQQDFPKLHSNRTAHSGRFSFPEHKPKEELFLSG